MNNSDLTDQTNSTADEKFAFWTSTMDAFEEAQASQKKFCESRNLSFHQFGYWRARLNRAKKKSAPAMIPVQISQGPITNMCSIHVKLPNGIELMLPEVFNEQTLSRLLRLLGVTSC